MDIVLSLASILFSKEITVRVYARGYTDATESFMTSGKEDQHQESIRKEPFMTSGKENQHQESIRKGITKNQDFILLALHRDPKLTIPELAEIVGIAQRNVSENLKKLQDLGLLKRVGGRKDGSWIVIGSLT